MEIHDFDGFWDAFIDRSTTFENFPPYQPPQIELSEVRAPIESSNLDWALVHSCVAEVAKTRFESRHYADAAEAALKLINEKVKAIVKDRTGAEYDGVALMQKAFSKDKPVLVLGDLSTIIGEDMQVGYQQIFSGAMRGIRNPKAHSNIRIDAVRAIHFIFLASLLMFKVDEAVTLENPPNKA